MKELRMIFSKKGPAAFISHLDLTRLFTRMLIRAKIPVWYTQGFNPHPYISFPVPLPLGFCGEREILNFSVSEDIDCSEAMAALNCVTPSGISIIDVYEPHDKATEIVFCRYLLSFESDVLSKANQFFSQDSIEVTKKTKRSETRINAVGYIKQVNAKNIDDKTYIEIILPINSEDSINPNLLTGAFCDFSGTICLPQITRIEMLKSDLSSFV